jgi:hypothetical protein
MFDVQIDLPYTSTGFVNDLLHQAKERGVNLILSKEPRVHLASGGECGGYFDGEKATLAVGCGRPFEEWFPVLIHESCHMDQWIDNAESWTGAYIGGTESVTLLDLWFDRHIELTEEQLWKVVDASREVERDCEERTVEKIIRYGLPFNPQEYAQKGNAYVYSYNMMGLTRKWYGTGNEPYLNESVWKCLPTDFNRDYTQTPRFVFDLYRTHVFPELNYINLNHKRISG